MSVFKKYKKIVLPFFILFVFFGISHYVNAITLSTIGIDGSNWGIKATATGSDIRTYNFSEIPSVIIYKGTSIVKTQNLPNYVNDIANILITGLEKNTTYKAVIKSNPPEPGVPMELAQIEKTTGVATPSQDPIIIGITPTPSTQPTKTCFQWDKNPNNDTILTPGKWWFSNLTSSYLYFWGPYDSENNCKDKLKDLSAPPKDTDTSYTLLAPLPGLGLGDNKPFETDNKKNPCAFGNYLNIMIKLIIGICAVLAMVMIVMGGIEYMTSELVSTKEQGKDTITNAILGLVIALGVFVILNTLNPDLLKLCLDNMQPATITMLSEEDQPQTYDLETKLYPNGIKFGVKWDDSVSQKATLPNYVKISPLKECITVGQPNCTSTRGLNPDNVKTTQWGCLCDLVITGGTEFWLHGGKNGKTTHKLDSGTVDLRLETKLNDYINKYGKKTEGKYGPVYTIGSISYLKENDHWHVYN